MVGETVALRPGLSVPDWSAVHDIGGRDALAASMAVAGRRWRWADLNAAEDRMRRAVLRSFVERGVGPHVGDLARAAGYDEDGALLLLRRLRERDLLVLDAVEEAVVACYPFSSDTTPHVVLLSNSRTPLHALCAIDALGTGRMLCVDTTVRSRCAHCRTAVTVWTCAEGARLASAEPEGVMVWSGIRYGGGCAATSGCALKLFFCSQSHLQAWKAANDPDGLGFALSLPVALEVGVALFGPLLPPDA